VTRGIDVSAQGVVVPSSVTGAVDVLLDGQRVWSFHPDRDRRPGLGHHASVPWPKALVGYLDGVCDVDLVDHVSREVLHHGTVRFGEATHRVRVVDGEGNPLAVDKGGRMQRDFSNTEDSAREEIMDALEQVLHDLTEACGLDAYLMYGCLLGAVRDGHMIGHDSDADVAYLSRHHHPFDIIRECTAATRTMRRLGWQVVRMSGANFKVWVPLPDGRRCGIDVFGSFHIGDHFYVTGSLTGTLDRSALVPFGTVTLEGREIVAPARPEEVLAFTYGPGWRVPDPAFHFDHDPADVRRMDAWFRSPRRRLRFWHDFYKGPDSLRVPTEPSLFARWVEQWMTERRSPGRILDVGAGTGRDATYFAEQGHRVTALDFSVLGMRRTRDLRAERGVKVTTRWFNLEDLRSVLVTGARFAHQKGSREVYARGLLDTLGPTGRDNFWRFAAMVQRRDGETFLEFRTRRSRREPKFFGPHQRTYLEPDAVVREIEAYGGRVVHRETGRDLAPLGSENPHICRLVVRWAS
jgi:SAM-dependent methyltransferase